MQKSFIRKPISILLSLLMVLSVFGGMTFTASAEDQMETINFRNEHEVRTISGTHFTITPHQDGGIYADGFWDFDGDYPDDYAELSAVYGETITKLVFHIDTGYDNYPIVKADGNSVAGSQSGDLWTFDNVNASSVNIFANPNYEEEGKEWWNFKVFELDVYFDASNAPAPSDIVAGLISAIGTVTLTNDCKEKIDAARSAYDNLAEADQALVSNYATLTDAEAAYQALVDQAAADRAIAAINKIGEFEVSPAYKVRFDQANNTYNGLTDAQKALVTNYDVLEAARAAAEALPYVSAGSFGGLYWAIDKDGVLTFAGSGETNMNAFRNNSSIRKVIINSSVTRLKSYSFGSCPNLTEVEFQNANPKIDNFVFADCGNLSKVTLAEGVTKIGYNMFYGCGSLHELDLPRSVNYIEGEAFAGSGIRALKIPYGLGHTTNALAGMGQLTTLVIDSDSAIAFTSSQFPELGSATNVYVPVGSTCKTEDTKKWDLVVKDEYLNDYDADDFAAARELFNMSVYDYYNEVSYALQEVEDYGYERDKYEAKEVTVPGVDVTLTDGAQVDSLFGAATIRTYTTAPSSVEALIAAIGTVNASDECKAKIDAARAAYDALSDELKALVSNYETLTAADTAYTELKSAADKAAADQAAADEVIALIDAIGTVEYTDDSKAKIDAAKAAYEALTDAQKALVANYDVLTAAEAAYDAILKVKEQPEDSAVSYGQLVSTTFSVAGEGVTYQWYGRNVGETKFWPSSLTGDTYSVIMDAKRSGRQVYCVATDANGNTVTSETVTLTMESPDGYALTVLAQPSDATAAYGKLASAVFSVSGDGLTYRWYLRNPGGTLFGKSILTNKTYGIYMSAKNSGREVYCVVTDAYGNTVTSDTVTLTMQAPESYEMTVSSQPVNVSAAEGKLASTKFSVSGEGLTYQWYGRDPGQTKFWKSGLTGDTYSIYMVPKKSGRQVYCVVTDAYGNTFTSDTVTLTMES